jgi:hypothetical protein
MYYVSNLCKLSSNLAWNIILVGPACVLAADGCLDSYYNRKWFCNKPAALNRYITDGDDNRYMIHIIAFSGRLLISRPVNFLYWEIFDLVGKNIFLTNYAVQYFAKNKVNCLELNQYAKPYVRISIYYRIVIMNQDLSTIKQQVA